MFFLFFNVMFLLLICVVVSSRMIKYRREIRSIVLRDIIICCFLSLLFSAFMLWFGGFATAIIILIYFLLNTVLFLDAYSTRFVGFEVSLTSIKQYFKYRAQVGESKVHNIQHIFYCLPLLILSFSGAFTIYFLFYTQHFYAIFFLALSVMLSVFILLKSKVNISNSLLLFIMALCLFYFVDNYKSFTDRVFVYYLESYYPCAIVVFGAIICYFFRYKLPSKFVFSNSIVEALFFNPIQSSSSFKPQSAEFNSIIKLNEFIPCKSSYHSIIKDAHVFVVTLESVTAAYLNDTNQVSGQLGNPGSSLMPFYESIRSSGWVSDYHVCSCPNTNSSFHDLFLGGYYNDESADFKQSYPQILQENGYEIAYSSPYDEEKEYICKYGLQNFLDPGSRDSDDFNELDWFSESLIEYCQSKRDKKLYLHIKNMQTHSPYHVYNHEDIKNLTRKQRYLLACNEADAMVESLYARLQKALDTDNILLVYTADHGQSFGEFDYFIHSSSVVKQQTQVPFAIYHPKLSARKISHSSHFDLFPTILDLLGIEYTKKNTGVSLGLDEVPFSHMLYSETRRGNLSSCFGHVNKDRKLYFDLVYGRFFEMDLNDNIVSVLDGDRLAYYKQVMLRAMQQRGLVGRLI